MDQFEIARQKNEKRLERLARSQANLAQAMPLPSVKVVFIEPPKEKEVVSVAPTAGIVEVAVTLPNGVFAFTLVKPAVYQNTVPTKLTKQSIVNAVRDGLRPLFGEMK